MHPINKIAFFGTSRFSIIILEDLMAKYGIKPSLIITRPDKPVGRKQIITPPDTKIWAKKNNIECFQPESLKNHDVEERLSGFDIFLVSSYGSILPKSIIDLPKYGTLNVHPSLLPKYRGASPIQNQILNSEKNMGVTIMLMDEQVDHGDIISQKNVLFDDPYIGPYEEVEEKLAHQSADLINEVMDKWINKEIKPVAQDHDLATYTKTIKKEDGLIDLNDDPVNNYRKYLAYYLWPKVYFYSEENRVKKRNIVTEAEFNAGRFKILKIIPEGKKETPYKPAV